MRLATCELRDGTVTVGAREGDDVFATGADSMRSVIADGDQAIEAIVKEVARHRRLDVGRVLAPLADSGKMLFCGLNYRGHAEENPDAVFPEEPFFFSKVPSAVIGDGQAIALPAPDAQTDWEVELAVVIGRTARDVPADQAMDHVFGYTVVNDVSARAIQFKDQQITLGKNPDTFCPMGPEIVLASELGDPTQLGLRSFVNGEVMQDASTSDMVFSIPTLVEFLTTLMTLHPGDIVSTGTPAGVGTFRSPPRYLEPGDDVVVEVDGIGRITNPVVARW